MKSNTVYSNSKKTKLIITPRGKVVLVVLVVFALLAVFMSGIFFNSTKAWGSSENTKVNYEYVSVYAGDSLWSIANKLAPESDARDVVYDITKLNALESTEVYPGQSLAIPAHYLK